MRRLLRSLIWNVISATALGAPTSKMLLMRGVEILDTTPAGIVISAEVECGERLQGILIRESGDRLGINLVVERAEVRCSGGTEVREFTLPFVKPAVVKGKVQEIVSLPTDEGDPKVSLQEAKLSATSSGLSLQWEHNCKDAVGAIFVPESSGQMSVAVAFSSSSRKVKGVNCEGGKRTMTLQSVDSSALHWESLSRPGKLDDIYALRVVAPKSVALSSSGEVSVLWEKRCREIPVGVLFSGVDKQTVAVVTAYLPNVTCNAAKKAAVTTTVAALSAVAKSHFHVMDAASASQVTHESYRLRLSAPERMEFTVQTKTVQVVTSSSCDQDFGVVVGQDASGNLAMASLVSESTQTCRVANGVSRQMLALRAAGDLKPRVFPLKVSGSAAH